MGSLKKLTEENGSKKVLLEEVKWRASVIHKYFLSCFPENAEEWILTTDLNQEFRKEFCEMLEELKIMLRLASPLRSQALNLLHHFMVLITKGVSN